MGLLRVFVAVKKPQASVGLRSLSVYSGLGMNPAETAIDKSFSSLYLSLIHRTATRASQPTHT